MCFNGIVYDRQQDDKVLTFFGSGLVWEQALILQDQSSGSLWSQLLGKAMEGERKGQTLQVIPTVLTDWKSWREKNPLTSVMVLAPMTHFYDSSCYVGRLGKYLIGTKQPGHRPKAWRFDQLTHEPVVNDRYAGQPIVVVFQEETGSATIFGRQLDGETLVFEQHESGFSDQQTQSVWDPLTGAAISGPLQGQQLQVQIAIPSFSGPWGQFHTDSEYWLVDLPLFFSAQIVENVGIRCEEVSRAHIIDLYRRSIDIKSTRRDDQAGEFFGRKR